MEFLPNLIKLPATVSDTARLSSVFPRLKVGMVLTALVLKSDGEQAVIRMRGMDVNAQSQVPLRPNQQVTLLVSELGREQVVLRVLPEAVPGGMTSLTDQDLRPFLVQASLPVDSEGFAAVRALILHGKALNPANVTELVAAARSAGSFEPPTLDAILFLQDRSLPVTARTIELAQIILTSGAHAAPALAELENLARTASASGSARGQASGPGTDTETGAATNRQPNTASAERSGSEGLRQSVRSLVQALPPSALDALQRLVELFPRIDLREPVVAAANQPVARADASPVPSETQTSAQPADTPAREQPAGAPAPGRDSPISRPSTSGAEMRPAGPPVIEQSAATSEPARDSAVSPSATSGVDTRPAGESDRSEVGTARAPQELRDAPRQGQTEVISVQIARLVSRIGTTLEARVANGVTQPGRADPRVLVAELQRELESALRNAPPQARETLTTAMAAARELSEALQSSQMLNAAPQLRDESGAYFIFQLPIRTADGWETGELKIYKRDSEAEIDPDNATVVLKLNMRHLGPVDAAVVIRAGAVSCDFRCERPDAVEQLQRDTASLASAIEGLGHSVSSINHQLVLPDATVARTSSVPAGRIDTRA